MHSFLQLEKQINDINLIADERNGLSSKEKIQTIYTLSIDALESLEKLKKYIEFKGYSKSFKIWNALSTKG